MNKGFPCKAALLLSCTVLAMGSPTWAASALSVAVASEFAMMPAPPNSAVGPDDFIARPFPGDDDPSVNIAVRIEIPTDFSSATLTIGPKLLYIPYEREDRWSVRTEIAADWTLIAWEVFRGRVEGPRPVQLKAEFRADPPNPLPPGLGFEPPGVGTGIEVELPWDGDPKLRYYTELRLGLGDDWYRVELPLLRYSWDTEEGRRYSGLGMWLDFYGPPGSCKDADDGKADCQFDRGTLTIWGNIPEPATWAMMIIGFGLVGWQLRRAPPTSRPSRA